MNLIVTFIYEDVCKYLNDWVASINRQQGDIKVMIFSDRVEDPNQYFSELRFDYQIKNVTGSVIENRFDAIDVLKDSDADNIIFQDADDLMSDNRVETCARYLIHAELAVNDLSLMTDDGKIISERVWSGRIENGFRFDHSFIRRWNIAGLGNTSIKRSLLQQPIKRPDRELIAADWFIFYQLLQKSSAKAIFTNECQTLYRQHAANIAGINQISTEKLARAISIKKAHYTALQSIGYDFSTEISELYKINSENGLLATYDIKQAPFWWEETELYEKN